MDKIGEIADPRRGSARCHDLLDVLAIALIASVCGAQSCDDVARFAADRQALLREFLGLKNGLPDHDTVSRVLRLLDPAGLAPALEAFLDDLGADGDGVLSIDGRSLRRSFERAAGRSALHMVVAFGSGPRIVLAQKAALAARAMLETLALGGVLVTGDGMHAEADTAELIRAKGGDWLFALRADDAAILGGLKALFADLPAQMVGVGSTDADPGRVETRRHRVTHAIDRLFTEGRGPGVPRLPGLAAVACVEPIGSENGHACRSTRFYLSSARLSPESFARAVRGDWAIEGGLHWVLDLDEDRLGDRRDNGAGNVAVLHRLARSLLDKARPKMTVDRKRRRFASSDTFARTIIGQMR